MQSKTEAYSGADGSYSVTSYNVFPGIELIYNDISLYEHDFRPEEGKALLEIHHCARGAWSAGSARTFSTSRRATCP